MTESAQAVVLVHGLWMRGPDMWLLARRLRRAGFLTYQFSYPTTRLTLDDAVRRLDAFVAGRVRAQRVHFVAHSLGGNVVHEFLHRRPSPRFGRAVVLGAPLQGSMVARQLAQSRLGRAMLGKILAGGLAEGGRDWRVPVELGVIAGSGRIGLGRFICALPGEHDGTVTVGETRIAGAAAHCVMPVSHMQMLVSATVARRVIAFLRGGCFEPTSSS
jgi:pimeloyl-ACP methyl ester carboxylesterase